LLLGKPQDFDDVKRLPNVRNELFFDCFQNLRPHICVFTPPNDTVLNVEHLR